MPTNQNPQPRQLIAGSTIAAASWIGCAYYWREVVNRATTITIKNNLLAIEEHKGKTVTYSKKLSVNTFRSVYCRRRFGRGTQYEVWVRLSNERTEFIVNTWWSKDWAERIRHFIATKLNIVEDANYINSLL